MLKGGILLKKELEGYSLFMYSLRSLSMADKVKFIRDFFGYKITKGERHYSYGGLLKKLNGIKVNNSSFFVPSENFAVVDAYLKSKEVEFIVKK